MTQVKMYLPGLGNEPIIITGSETPSYSFSKQMASIESLFSEMTNFKIDLSAEAFNPVETIKKVVTWIVEKIKQLIQAISDFIRNVRSYLDAENHKKIMRIKDYNAAVLNKYFKVKKQAVPNEQIEKLLLDVIGTKAFDNYDTIKLFVNESSSSQSKILSNSIRDTINLLNSYKPMNNDDGKLVPDNDIKEIFSKPRNDLEKLENFISNQLERSTASTELTANEEKKILEIMNNYHILLYADVFIEDKLVEVLKTIQPKQARVEYIGKQRLDNETLPEYLNEMIYLREGISVLFKAAHILLFNLRPIPLVAKMDKLIYGISKYIPKDIMNS